MNINNLSKYFLKLARNPFKEKEIDILERNIGKYIHFTNSDKLTFNFINEQNEGLNPSGIYGFKLTDDALDKIINNINPYEFSFAERKNIYIFDVKGNILNEENININKLINKLLSIIFSKYNFNEKRKNDIYEAIQARKDYPTHNNTTQELIYYLRDINSFFKSDKIYIKESFGLLQLFRLLKIDGIEIDNYGFNDEIKSQFIIFNPKSLIIIDKIDNPLFLNKFKPEIDEEDIENELYKIYDFLYKLYLSDDFLKYRNKTNKLIDKFIDLYNKPHEYAPDINILVSIMEDAKENEYIINKLKKCII